MKTQIWIRTRAVREHFTPDLSFVPPLQRRRLSSLQRVMFSICQDLAGGERDYTLFFASRDGEYRLTHRLVDDYREEGEVSPLRFSTSVYNAAPGLFSVFTGNRSAYSALAAGEETVECGLLEALLERGNRLWVYAEETGGGYGCGAMLADEPGVGTPLLLTPGEARRPLLTFDAVKAFLGGEGRRLEGRYLTLEVTEGSRW